MQKYISLSGHTYAPEPVLISVMAWKKLNPEQQALLRKAAEDTRDWQRQLCRDSEGKFRKTIEDRGMAQINEDVDKEAFVKATAPVYKMYTDKFGDANIKAIQAIK